MANVKITPTQKELDLYQKMFNEAAFMGGTEFQYYSVKKKEITGTSSEIYEWNDPIKVDGIYDQRPKVSLLKRLNWFTEDTDNQPSVLYLPIKQGDKVLTVKRGDLVEVKSLMNPAESNKFQVSEVRTDVVPLTFVCNMTPYREPAQKEGSGSTNNVWLNTND